MTSRAELKKIESNWNEFEKWCGQVGDDRKDSVIKMVEHFGERACMAPASSRLEFHNAFPGGLIDHSLRVLQNSVILATSFKVRISKESLIISSLFHDWGKVGDLDVDYYLPEESEWHRKTLGQMYRNNPNVKVPNAQLGLMLMNHFNVVLSRDEYLAILLNDGQYATENKYYAMKEPSLALLVHFADRWSTQCEKNRASVLDPVVPAF